MLALSKPLFLLLSFYFFMIGITSPSYAHELQSDVTVLIDETGFTPSLIYIEPHTTVTFLNVGDAVHWPASDAHPTHSHYSDTVLETHCASDYLGDDVFDSCREVGPGESWSFTFEKTGQHTFHDHIWSHLGGSILVEKNEQVVQSPVWKKILNHIMRFVYSIFNTTETQTQLNLIESTQLDKKEYLETRDTLLTNVSTFGATAAIENLMEMSLNNEKIFAQCHDLLHEIGKEAFLKYGSFSDAVKHKTDYCNSGYIHGLFESYFESKDGDAIEISNLCADYSKAGRPFDSWQCYHGVGHGFMYQYGGNLDQALTSCTQLQSPESINYCTNGVYMELFNNEILASEMSFIDYTNPLSSCDDVTTGKSDCLFYAPTYFSQNMGYSHLEIMDLCNTLPPHLSNTCIAGTAAEAAKRNQANLTEVIKLCEFENTNNKREACMSGIIGLTINQTASVDETLAVCNELAEPDQLTCRTLAESHRSFLEIQ